ncbi:hypothetical protein VCHENC02_4132B, partial [Vibrio harveyi]
SNLSFALRLFDREYSLPSKACHTAIQPAFPCPMLYGLPITPFLLPLLVPSGKPNSFTSSSPPPYPSISV